MALKSDAQGFLIGDVVELRDTLEIWREIRDDVRAIMDLLRRQQMPEAPDAPTTEAPAIPNIERRPTTALAVTLSADSAPIPTIIVNNDAERVPDTAHAQPALSVPEREFASSLDVGSGPTLSEKIFNKVINRLAKIDARLARGFRTLTKAIEELGGRFNGGAGGQGGLGGAGGAGGFLSAAGGALAALGTITGLKKDGWLRRGAQAVASKTGGALKTVAGKAAAPIAVGVAGLGSINEWRAADKDTTLTERERTIKKSGAAGRFGGLLGGMAVGAKGGAALGAFLGPIGAAVGGVIGGIGGSIVGALAGEKLSETVAEAVTEDVSTRTEQNAVTSSESTDSSKSVDSTQSHASNLTTQTDATQADLVTSEADTRNSKADTTASGFNADTASIQVTESDTANIAAARNSSETATTETVTAADALKLDWTPGAIAESHVPDNAATVRNEHGRSVYGLHALDPAQGTVQRFLKTTDYGQHFNGLKPGTVEFDAKWQATANQDANFATAQRDFAKREFYDTQIQRLEKKGIDLSERGPAVKEAVFSTAAQYGGQSSIIEKALRENDAKLLQDEQIVSLIQDYKAAHNDTLLARLPVAERQSNLERIESERAALLQPTIQLDTKRLTRDLESGGLLRESATASTAATLSTADVVTLTEAMDASAVALQQAAPQAVLELQSNSEASIEAVEQTATQSMSVIERVGKLASSAWESIKEGFSSIGKFFGFGGAGGDGGQGGTAIGGQGGDGGSAVVSVAAPVSGSVTGSVGNAGSPGLGTTPFSGAIAAGDKQLLERLAHGEGTSDVKAQKQGFRHGYDVSYAFGKYSPKGKNLSDMTLREVKQYQEQMLANQKGNKLQSTAVGKYQFIRKTLDATQKKLGISDDTVFSPEIQDRMGMELLRVRGYDKWKKGEMSDASFQKGLSQEWASVANPETGRSYYGQHVGTTSAEIQQAMAAAKSGIATATPANQAQVTTPASPVIATATPAQPVSGYQSIADYAKQTGLGAVGDGFGPRKPPKTTTGHGSSNHQGIDIKPKTRGATPDIRALEEGVVTSVGEAGKAGNQVVIKHADGTTSSYNHLSGFSTKVGEKVTRDTVLGQMGTTGNSSGSHLHLATKDASGKFMDPEKWLKRESRQAPAPAATAVATTIKIDEKALTEALSTNGVLRTTATANAAPAGAVSDVRTLQQAGDVSAIAAQQASGLVNNFSTHLYQQTQTAIDRGVKYNFGAKNSSTGGIDCSGWVSEINNNYIKSIASEAQSPEQVKQAQKLFTDGGGGAAMIVENISKATGQMLTNEQMTADTLKEGMIIGEDNGKTKWDAGRFKGIDHITQVVRDPKSGKLMVSQSSSKKGVNLIEAEKYLAQKNKRGTKLYGVDTNAAIHGALGVAGAPAPLQPNAAPLVPGAALPAGQAQAAGVAVPECVPVCGGIPASEGASATTQTSDTATTTNMETISAPSLASQPMMQMPQSQPMIWTQPTTAISGGYQGGYNSYQGGSGIKELDQVSNSINSTTAKITNTVNAISGAILAPIQAVSEVATSVRTTRDVLRGEIPQPMSQAPMQGGYSSYGGSVYGGGTGIKELDQVNHAINRTTAQINNTVNAVSNTILAPIQAVADVAASVRTARDVISGEVTKPMSQLPMQGGQTVGYSSGYQGSGYQGGRTGIKELDHANIAINRTVGSVQAEINSAVNKVTAPILAVSNTIGAVTNTINTVRATADAVVNLPKTIEASNNQLAQKTIFDQVNHNEYTGTKAPEAPRQVSNNPGARAIDNTIDSIFNLPRSIQVATQPLGINASAAQGALPVALPSPAVPAPMAISNIADAPAIPEPLNSSKSGKDSGRSPKGFDVGQDVRDRRIAHIVTGGIGAPV